MFLSIITSPLHYNPLYKRGEAAPPCSLTLYPSFKVWIFPRLTKLLVFLESSTCPFSFVVMSIQKNILNNNSNNKTNQPFSNSFFVNFMKVFASFWLIYFVNVGAKRRNVERDPIFDILFYPSPYSNGSLFFCFFKIVCCSPWVQKSFQEVWTVLRWRAAIYRCFSLPYFVSYEPV